jgi:hypothetical protein
MEIRKHQKTDEAARAEQIARAFQERTAEQSEKRFERGVRAAVTEFRAPRPSGRQQFDALFQESR